MAIASNERATRGSKISIAAGKSRVNPSLHFIPLYPTRPVSLWKLCARHEFDLAIRFGVSRSRSRKPAALDGNLEEHHPAWWIVSDKSISMARQATEMKQRLREIHWHLLDREASDSRKSFESINFFLNPAE